jgi:hypothetical protein
MGTKGTKGPNEAEIAAQVDRLVDDHRISSLWFLRPDYYPSTNDERIRVLRHIEKHGDLEAFRQAASLKRWLLPTSSAASVDS